VDTKTLSTKKEIHSPVYTRKINFGIGSSNIRAFHDVFTRISEYLLHVEYFCNSEHCEAEIEGVESEKYHIFAKIGVS